MCTDKTNFTPDMEYSLRYGAQAFCDDDSSETFNIDTLLKKLFTELFNTQSTNECITDSSLALSLRQKKANNHDSSFFSQQSIRQSSADIVEERTLKKLKVHGNNLHFSIVELPNEETLVFQIFEEISHITKQYDFHLKKLDAQNEKQDDGTIKRTYYIDSISANGNSLIFFTFTNTDVVINVGLLEDRKVQIIKKPMHIDLQEVQLRSTKNDSLLFQINDNCQYFTLSHDVDADIDTDIFVIDTVTHDIVKRQVFFDNKKQKYAAKMHLIQHRNYFSFQIKQNGNVFPHTAEIGHCYLFGHYDFPKDIVRAAEFFEKDDSADSLLGIGYIYSEFSEFQDATKEYEFYTKAIKKGSDLAAVEFALLLMNTNTENMDIPNLLQKAVENEFAPAQFLLAEFYELNHCCKEDSFNLYYCAAKQGYRPAQLRLSNNYGSEKDWSQYNSICDIRTFFDSSIQAPNGLAEYCLGGMLLYGWDVLSRKSLGVSYLEKSIKKGNRDAALELFDFYVEELLNNGTTEITKLILCGENVISFCDNPKDCNRYANTLLDVEPNVPGIDRLCVKFLIKAILLDHDYRSAINNLGWTFKKGRGTKQDYDRARELFEKASSLGCSSSYFHLGDMYENGMGVDKSLDKAIEYYQKGADLKNETCRERLNFLVPSLTDERDDYLKKIYEYVVETNAKVMEIGDLTKEMKVLLERITDIQSEISSRKAIFQSQQNSDDNTETAYKQFIDSMAETMCQKLYQSGNVNVDFEENSLKGIFGDYWDCLDEYTRKSLVSARIFLSGSNSLSRESLDYSGVVISATSALENELKLRFFNGYQAYLRKQFKNDFSKWPRSMVYDGRVENTVFTIGSLPGIFGSQQRGENGKRFYNKKMSVTPAEKELLNDYLKTILYYGNDDINTFFKTDIHGLSFLDRCEDVRCMYRNAAAHTESLSIEEATACCRDIIGVDRYDATLKVGQIQGLILDLVKLSRIPANI